MRYLYIVIVNITLFFGYFPSMYAGGKDASNMNNTLSKMVYYISEWPPYSYKNSSGEITGYNLEILNKIYDQLGLEKPTVYMRPWDITYVSTILSEKPAAIGAITEIEYRKSDFTFTLPVSTVSTAIYCSKDSNISIKNSDDLKKFHYIVGEHDVNTLILMQLGVPKSQFSFVTISQGLKLINNITESKIKCLAFGTESIEYFERHGLIQKNKIEKVYDLFQGNVGYGFNKNTPKETVNIFNNELKKILSNKQFIENLNIKYGIN